MPAPHHDAPKTPPRTPDAAGQDDLFAAGDFVEEIGGGEIPESIQILVDEDREARIIEYAPGQFAAVLGREMIPKYGIVRFDHVGNNQYRATLVGWRKMIALWKFFRPDASGSEPHPILLQLGLDLSYNSVLRLYKNGFVRGCMPVPHRILIDIESLNRHLQEASDPDYWTKDRIARFRETVY